MVKNTNAQENVGKLFQFFHPKNKLSFKECLEHTWRFCSGFVYDCKHVRLVAPTSYGFFNEKSQDKRKKESVMDQKQNLKTMVGHQIKVHCLLVVKGKK